MKAESGSRNPASPIQISIFSFSYLYPMTPRTVSLKIFVIL